MSFEPLLREGKSSNALTSMIEEKADRPLPLLQDGSLEESRDSSTAGIVSIDLRRRLERGSGELTPPSFVLQTRCALELSTLPLLPVTRSPRLARLSSPRSWVSFVRPLAPSQLADSLRSPLSGLGALFGSLLAGRISGKLGIKVAYLIS